uniref:LITAF domain-containing protein n=1 Tax=Panagrolaimus sp. ES5 TaxID=591445 RepID=A0AC34FIM4_9BILA
MSEESKDHQASGPPPPPYEAQPAVVHVQVASPATGVGVSPVQSGIIIAQPVVFYGQRSSFRTQCPFCKAHISTRCNTVFSTMDFIMLIIGILVLFPLICIVACCSPWHDFEHFCPSCGQFLGRSNCSTM